VVSRWIPDRPETAEAPPLVRARIDNTDGYQPKGTYMMVGFCSNCGDGPFVIVHRRSSSAHPARCPTCDCGSVHSKRLATDEEAGIGA
jgi:hypothetical protein